MKWLWKKMWLGLLEALKEWLKTSELFEPEGKRNGAQLPKDSIPLNSMNQKQVVNKTETVGKQAHEILKGRR